MNEILEEGILRMPIVVDGKTGVILDGHHRYHALRRLGAELVPTFLVNYSSQEVSVFPRRIGYKVSKRLVVDMAMEGKLMPPKTTRHVLEVEPRPVNVSLRELLRREVDEI